MPRLFDNPPHSIYRVTVRSANREFTRGSLARVNVKASSPSAAVDWVLSYPHLCHIPHTTGLMQVLAAYKLKRQPVWLRKAGTLAYRFDTRSVETYRLNTAEL